MIVSLVTLIFIAQLIIAVSYGRQYKLLKNQSRSKKSTLPQVDSISVLIPFHNESKRILPLLNAINQLAFNYPVEFIFINDKSNDETERLIGEYLDIEYRLIFNGGKKGKKFAIREGVNQAKGDFIITWDADVVPSKSYFINLSLDRSIDMLILPVVMGGNTMIQRLGSIEFYFLQFLGFGMANKRGPQLCNGANLVYKKQSFLDVELNRNDYGIASGDDMFLLQAMLSDNKTFSLKTMPMVETNAPNTWKNLIQQRRRWIGKMGNMPFGPLSFFAFLLFLMQIGFIISVIGLFFSPLFLIPIIIKISAELIVLLNLKKMNVLDYLILFVHQFWYPFYLVSLSIPVGIEERWRSD